MHFCQSASIVTGTTGHNTTQYNMSRCAKKRHVHCSKTVRYSIISSAALRYHQTNIVAGGKDVSNPARAYSYAASCFTPRKRTSLGHRAMLSAMSRRKQVRQGGALGLRR
jgi:hypothetical protein